MLKLAILRPFTEIATSLLDRAKLSREKDNLNVPDILNVPV